MKLWLGLILIASTAEIFAVDVGDIERRRLFEPTPGELRAEAAGRIYIYDGLRDIDVELAMDREFGRVENMMFIREKKTDDQGEVMKNTETGEDVVEDDGC